MGLPEINPHIVGVSVGEAYVATLESGLSGLFPHSYRTIHISEPVKDVSDVPRSLDTDLWTDTVNARESLSRFRDYEFHDGTTGRFWVQDRIEELFSGMYAARLAEPANQIQMIVSRLSQGNHGQTTNALVAQVFQIDPDLERATHGRPMAPDMACLTQLQFLPHKDRLNLFSVFRSQYLETKCYGNLFSLAVLLAAVCDMTGYEPGFLCGAREQHDFPVEGGLAEPLPDPQSRGGERPMDESEAVKEMNRIGLDLELDPHTLDIADNIIEMAIRFAGVEDDVALGAASILIACEEREIKMLAITVA